MALKIPAYYYQQFDADYSRDVPAEGYGGWKRALLEIEPERTALVVMHAWDCGTYKKFPGWWRSEEYIPRARKICRNIFPKLLKAARRSPLRIFHVAGGGDYYKKYPGYKKVAALAGAETKTDETIEQDASWKKLRQFRAHHCDVGKRNQPDVSRGFKHIDFAPQARPLKDEPVASTARELFAVCREFGVNHLIYTGFAINWCLLLSPGGMHDMSRYGLICSTVKEAVTAVENKETARHELCKEIALWRVAVAFGFVYNLDDLLRGLSQMTGMRKSEPRQKRFFKK